MNKNKNINGILISKTLYQELNKYLLTKNTIPIIADISIGNNFSTLMYSKMKQKIIQEETKIKFQSIHFDDISLEELKQYIKKLNQDKKITGILVQLPLPKHLQEYEREILNTIDKNKDIDGLTSFSNGLLSTNLSSFIPCTALGIETLLKVYNISLEGKKVAIINRSNLIGKPLIHLMLKNNATPIICHSKTSNLAELTKLCDIVIAALNKQEYITSEYLKDNSIVIDVGVHKNNLNKTVGDVNYNDVYSKVSLITPAVGGIGPMTICMLAYNTAKALYGQEINLVLNKGIIKSRQIISNK